MLSIVIPTLNRPQSLVKLVTSLKSQNIASSQREILVVYNNSTEALHSPLHNDAEVRVLAAPKPGVNNARNHGAREARGDVILFIDDDCVADDPYFLQSHFESHQLHPQQPAVGGPYRLTKKASLWDQIYQANNEQWIESNRLGPHESLALLGGNTSYKASVFRQGLYFTEEISYGGSETPLNTLLSLQKGPLGYFESLAITHETQMDWTSLIRKAYRQGQGAAIQTQLYGHPLQQITKISLHTSPWVRRGLELYAFVFMIGYKSQLFGKSIFRVFFQEFWTRYVLNEKEGWGRVQKKYWGKAQAGAVQAYWWQYSKIRHPVMMFGIRTYWLLHSLLAKFFLVFKIQYFKIRGFLTTLNEPLSYCPNASLLTKLKERINHVLKKFGWLFLKTVGLR